MTTGKRPDGTVFASGASEGEVQDFPAPARGWGVTIDGKDERGTAVTDATNGIPPMEWFNSLQRKTDQNLLWLLQNALPDWLAGTWPKGAVVVNADIVWRAQKDTTTEPTSGNGDWLALFPLQNLDGRYVPQTRKINGHTLNTDANVTAQDIFNGQVVDIGNAVDLNTITTPGLYRQAANAQAASGKNYPESAAGSLEVYKHAGVTQVYRVYNNSRQYARTLYGGTWSAWGKGYDTNNKPTASDTAALPITGGNVTGAISVGEAKKFSINPQNSATLDAHLNHWGSADRPTVLEFGDATSYHFYSQRNKDGSIIFTSAGTLNPTNWTNFDARYYTQTAANGKFQPKGSYTPAGEAYTKAQSDARYNLKNTASLGATGGWQQDGTTGLIIQMGIVNRTAYGTGVTFPKAFPNYCMGVLVSLNMYIGSLSDSQTNIRALAHSKTGFTYGAGGDPEKTAFWVAFGK
ncbi:pyocin knob domain-containing protein [Enterobacter asburiae]